MLRPSPSCALQKVLTRVHGRQDLTRQRPDAATAERAKAPPLILSEFEGGDPVDARERKLGIRTPIHPSRLKHGCETVAGRKGPGRGVRLRDVQKHWLAAGLNRKAPEE